MSLYPIPSSSLTNPLTSDLNCANNSLSYINKAIFVANQGELLNVSTINGAPYAGGSGSSKIKFVEMNTPVTLTNTTQAVLTTTINLATVSYIWVNANVNIQNTGAGASDTLMVTNIRVNGGIVGSSTVSTIPTRFSAIIPSSTNETIQISTNALNVGVNTIEIICNVVLPNPTGGTVSVNHVDLIITTGYSLSA